MGLEAISTDLLDEIEIYLSKRVDINSDGGPNDAMRILIRLEKERDADSPVGVCQ